MSAGAQIVDSRNRWEWIGLLLVLAMGLGARLLNITYSLDGDEIFSSNLVAHSFTETLWLAFLDSPHPPLHNILLHAWTLLFGHGEFALRSLSLLFSIGFLVVAYALMRRVLPVWLALGCTALLAFNPLLVFYGQQARPYALIAFFAAWNIERFLSVLEAPEDRRRQLHWALSGLLLMYVQYMGALVVGAGMLTVWFYRSPAWRGVTVLGVLTGLAMLAWMVAAAWYEQARQDVVFGGFAWIGPPDINTFVWFFVALFGEFDALQVRWLMLALLIILGAYAVKLLRKRRLPAEHAYLVLLALLVPLAAFALSVAGPRSIFVPRQLIGSGIAFTALLGLGLNAMPRALGAVLLSALLAWVIYAFPNDGRDMTRQPWREIFAELARAHEGVPMLAQEPWIFQPMGRYQPQGTPIKLVDALGVADVKAPFLFVCRPLRCWLMDEPQRASRATLVFSRSLAQHPDEPSKFTDVRAYLVRPEPR
ncbi:MAG: glycosyltransferase family 39 protein [Gammaproteobacteria bacterium]|nr:glycosyltransferase family 39 protein [Gammaproteobacteria bacterium]